MGVATIPPFMRRHFDRISFLGALAVVTRLSNTRPTSIAAVGDGKISARAIRGRPIPLLGSARRCMLIELALAELTLSPACRPVPLDEKLMARHPRKVRSCVSTHYYVSKPAQTIDACAQVNTPRQAYTASL